MIEVVKQLLRRLFWRIVRVDANNATKARGIVLADRPL